jgi:hypothetical protein
LDSLYRTRHNHNPIAFSIQGAVPEADPEADPLAVPGPVPSAVLGALHTFRTVDTPPVDTPPVDVIVVEVREDHQTPPSSPNLTRTQDEPWQDTQQSEPWPDTQQSIWEKTSVASPSVDSDDEFLNAPPANGLPPRAPPSFPRLTGECAPYTPVPAATPRPAVMPMARPPQQNTPIYAPHTPYFHNPFGVLSTPAQSAWQHTGTVPGPRPVQPTPPVQPTLPVQPTAPAARQPSTARPYVRQPAPRKRTASVGPDSEEAPKPQPQPRRRAPTSQLDGMQDIFETQTKQIEIRTTIKENAKTQRYEIKARERRETEAARRADEALTRQEQRESQRELMQFLLTTLQGDRAPRAPERSA